MRRITTISLAALMVVSSLGLFACRKKNVNGKVNAPGANARGRENRVDEDTESTVKDDPVEKDRLHGEERKNQAKWEMSREIESKGDVKNESAWEKDGKAKSLVDCNAVCKRTFDTCLEDVMLNTGKVTKKQIELIKKMGKLKEAGKQGYDQCLSKCRDQDGIASDGDEINECMGKKSCEDFAKCMKSVIDD
jgi:hypothetical protein